jgi:hypothetical protein
VASSYGTFFGGHTPRQFILPEHDLWAVVHVVRTQVAVDGSDAANPLGFASTRRQGPETAHRWVERYRQLDE